MTNTIAPGDDVDVTCRNWIESFARPSGTVTKICSDLHTVQFCNMDGAGEHTLSRNQIKRIGNPTPTH